MAATLADQIRDLGDRSLGDLSRLRAYYENTKSVWRLAREFADEGRDVIVRNPAMGRALDSSELQVLAQNYVTVYLAESVLEKTVSLVEDFVFGLLNVWLVNHPLGIPHKDRQLTLRVVLDAPDLQTVVQHFIDKELDGLKYESVPRWFSYFASLVDLGVPDAGGIASLAEAKARRDVIVHNAGVVNPTYARKAGTAAAYRVGDRVEVQEPYFYDFWTLVERLFEGMTAAAVGKA